MCPPSGLSTSHASTAKSRPDISKTVPQTMISKSAYEHAASVLAPTILNHSLRVYQYTKALAEHANSIYSTDPAKHDLLFTACLFHDIGTTATYNGMQRFEVEGADAAVKHLSQFDVSEAEKHDVWTAIAIHTSPGIAERIGELSRLVRVALDTEFGKRSAAWEVLDPLKEKVEADFERGCIEKILSDAVVEQSKSRPEKAPMVSWPGVLYKAWLTDPEWDGVNKAF